MIIISNWLTWGIYAAMCVESGVAFGSKNLNWGSVESDFLIPNNRMYGGGVGLIQFTSKNFELLLAIKKMGFDISSMPNGNIKNDLINERKSINWFVSSASPSGGLFNLSETQFIKKMLKSEQGKKVQSKFIKDYFNVDNKVCVDLLKGGNMPDIVKAFLVNLIVLYPAGIRNICNASPQSLQAAKQMCLNQVGYSAGYINRFDYIINGLSGINLTNKPPVDVFEFGESGNENGNKTNNETPGDDRPNKNNQPPNKGPAKIELYEGDLYIKNNFLYQLERDFYIPRFNDHFSLRFNDEDVHKDNTNNHMNDTSQKPNENIPNDKENIINEFINELTKIPLNTLNYANIRPQQNPLQCGWADCSGFVGWGLRNIHPAVWNNGYINTGTIYNIFKSNGFLIWEGSIFELKNHKPHKGDILEFSDDTTFGAGNDKHVIVYIGDDTSIDMNGNGNMKQNYTQLTTRYLSGYGFNYACIIRIVK